MHVGNALPCLSARTFARAPARTHAYAFAYAYAHAQAHAHAHAHTHAHAITGSDGSEEMMDPGGRGRAEPGSPSPLASAHTFVGTVTYMSPERINGESRGTKQKFGFTHIT